MKFVIDREAEKWLPLLLDEVEKGEAIAITRAGKMIAELRPATSGDMKSKPTPEEIHEAMGRIRARARDAGHTFDQDEVKSWRDEGRA